MANMRNYTPQLWLGAWLLVLPFLGIPGSWKETLTALTALALIGRAIWLYHRSRAAADLESDKSGCDRQDSGQLTPPPIS